MEYMNGNRIGMLFNPHGWNKIEEFIKGRNVIYQGEKRVGKNCYFEKTNYLCHNMRYFI